MYKLDLGKNRGTRDQIANNHWITEKTREFQKNIYFCFIDYTKAFDFVDHNKLWKIQETGIPDHLGNLYTGQEAIFRTRHGTMSQFQIGIGGHQGCILSSCYLTLCGVHHAKCWDGWLTNWNQDCQININNLRCADDTNSLQRAKMNWRISWWRWKNGVKRLA